MMPEQQHADAVEAAHEWRDEQRAQVGIPAHLPEPRYRRVWVDTGSGPGIEVTVPVTPETPAP